MKFTKIISHILTVLGVNAVPVVGWFFEGWSPSTTLLVYWFENTAASFFMITQIILHRRAIPYNGHFYYTPSAQNGKRVTQGRSFLSSFFPISFAFCTFHAVFLAAILFIIMVRLPKIDAGLDWHVAGKGCAIVLLFLAVDFLVDLPGLKRKSFFWIEQKAEHNLTRVFVIHMTILLGMFAIAFTGTTKIFFSIFVGLKTLNDLSSALPQWKPADPPKWLCYLMDKAPGSSETTFIEFWHKDNADEIARRAKNEKQIREQ